MNYPDIDTRTKEDVVHQMKELAVSYTPEWRFDEENPDLGTALAYIYADMFGHTIRRFNQVALKQELEFFNQIGARLLPSVPATGYVTFSLVNHEVAGTEVKRGTKVLSQTDPDTGKPVVFETENTVYVTPAAIDEILITNGEQDYICPIYSSNEDQMHSFTLFRTTEKNCQEHVFYFSQDTILNISTAGTIELEFDSVESKKEKDWLERLMKEGDVTLEYSTEYGYLPFREMSLDGNRILLSYTKDMAPFRKRAEQGEENYWIRMTVNRIDGFETMNLRQILLSSKAYKVLPQMISSNEVEQTLGSFYPFGEYYAVYNELYIACGEALSKKGATVTMNFTLAFQELPPENPIELPSIHWKPVMKKAEFVEPPTYDMTISKVIWEYFNGQGWCRLFTDSRYEDIFYPKETRDETKQKLEFTCPMDIEPVLVNSMSSFFIRARVIKVNNAYKTNANCITPIMDNVCFDYMYGKKKLGADTYIMKNNMETKTLFGHMLAHSNQGFYPFSRWETEQYAMYLGFQRPPCEAPIRILFEMGETIQEKLPRMQVSYSSDGEWKTLNMIDQTENFRRTGILTILGNHDIKPMTQFGKEYYWIRFLDVNNQYSSSKDIKRYPHITKIVPNTTEIIEIEKKLPEYFYIEPNQENYTCTLLEGKIYDIKVWVNEINTLSRKEIDEIRSQRAVDFKYSDHGELQEAWVIWDRVENFTMSGQRDRHYVVDEIQGIVSFSDGRHGVIPSSGDNETIRIEYSCGGGECGNLKEGAIQELSSTQGFINEVYNPLMTTGGCNQETVKEAVMRSAMALKHGSRAVMLGDYEALAMEASRSIIKAKCFANMNPQGNTEYGTVTLVLLHKNYEQSAKFFEGIREKVSEYMKPCLEGNLKAMHRFHIIEPRLLKLNVDVSLSIRDYNLIFEVKEKVLLKLYEFINPIAGNFNHQGFGIGVLPNSTQIMNAVKMIPGVIFVRNVRITAYVRGEQDWQEIDLNQQANHCFDVAMSGTHDVLIDVVNS